MKLPYTQTALLPSCPLYKSQLTITFYNPPPSWIPLHRTRGAPISPFSPDRVILQSILSRHSSRLYAPHSLLLAVSFSLLVIICFFKSFHRSPQKRPFTSSSYPPISLPLTPFWLSLHLNIRAMLSFRELDCSLSRPYCIFISRVLQIKVPLFRIRSAQASIQTLNFKPAFSAFRLEFYLLPW